MDRGLTAPVHPPSSFLTKLSFNADRHRAPNLCSHKFGATSSFDDCSKTSWRRASIHASAAMHSRGSSGDGRIAGEIFFLFRMLLAYSAPAQLTRRARRRRTGNGGRVALATHESECSPM